MLHSADASWKGPGPDQDSTGSLPANEDLLLFPYSFLVLKSIMLTRESE